MEGREETGEGVVDVQIDQNSLSIRSTYNTYHYDL